MAKPLASSVRRSPSRGVLDLLSMVTLAVFILVAGCGESRTETAASSSAKGEEGVLATGDSPEGGTFRVALETPTSLDPALTDDAYEATVVGQIFSGLVQLDANLNVLPDLAQSWVISRDMLEYRFELRRDARFHNGRPVTAQDFVYTFTRLLDATRIPPGIIQDYLMKVDGAAEFAAGRADHIRGLEAVDAFTLKIRLAAPYASFLSVLTMDQAKVLPREEVERLGAEGFGMEPVGSGPFRFGSWERDKALRLSANRDYFGSGPYMDSLIFVHDPDGRADWRKQAFLDGKLDVLSIRDKELHELKNRGHYHVMRRPELSVDFIGFNMEHPVCRDRRVRRAVAMAIDREALIQLAGKGFAAPSGILPPGISGFTPDIKVLPHDPEQARRLLAEAGYDAAHPLHLPLMTASRTVFAVRRDSVIAASLARVGIQVDFAIVTWEAFDQALGDRTAAAFQLAWIADLPDPDSFLYSLFISGGSSNLFSYSNAHVDEILEIGGRDTDQVARLHRYREAERLILEDAVIIPLFNVIATYIVQPRVGGVELSPFGLSSVPMERIRLDGEDRLHAGF